MKKVILIGFCITTVVFLILSSFSNALEYHSNQLSKYKEIKNEVNQRELLFQTIVDISNNKEIQRIILKSQMSRGIFPESEIPVITKSQLKQMYVIGLLLSKIIGKSRIQSIVQEFQFNNQDMQKEFSTNIEKDAMLNTELTQLANLKCDCENKNPVLWNFPIICTLLWPFFILALFLYVVANIVFLGEIIGYIGAVLNCWWP